jgi:hypothetical protein
VSKVGTSSVGFGPNDLKFGGEACEEATHEEKLEPNCYSMFRAKSVGTSFACKGAKGSNGFLRMQGAFYSAYVWEFKGPNAFLQDIGWRVKVTGFDFLSSGY